MTRSGLHAQLGFKLESAFGTAVTVDNFLPLVSESITNTVDRMESAGIIAGRRVLASDQWAAGNQDISGDIELELYNRGLGQLFLAAMGSVTTTGSGPYTHVFEPGDLFGDSLTVQVGRPGTAGTVHPFTYAGVKVGSWTMACSQGELATMQFSVMARSETTATALASANYPATIKPLNFTNAEITLAGTPIKVKSFTISGDNQLSERRFLGDDLMDEAIEGADRRTYEGSLDIEFSDLTQYNVYKAGTEGALKIEFTQGTDKVTVEANVRLDGETPTVGGTDILEQSVNFKAIGATDAAAMKITVINADATVALGGGS